VGLGIQTVFVPARWIMWPTDGRDLLLDLILEKSLSNTKQ
jgi:hypothetical protein